MPVRMTAHWQDSCHTTTGTTPFRTVAVHRGPCQLKHAGFAAYSEEIQTARLPNGGGAPRTGRLLVGRQHCLRGQLTPSLLGTEWVAQPLEALPGTRCAYSNMSYVFTDAMLE